jgi:hypothetical protein
MIGRPMPPIGWRGGRAIPAGPPIGQIQVVGKVLPILAFTLSLAFVVSFWAFLVAEAAELSRLGDSTGAPDEGAADGEGDPAPEDQVKAALGLALCVSWLVAFILGIIARALHAEPEWAADAALLICILAPVLTLFASCWFCSHWEPPQGMPP